MISNAWAYIMAAVLMSCILRFLPLLFKNKLEKLKSSSFIIFLNYASCAIIGGMIYSTAFNSSSLSVLYDNAGVNDFLKMVVLIVSFIINIRIKNAITTFLLCIGGYAGLSYFIL